MQPDFQRDVYCLLGLPFDAITERQAELTLRQRAQSGTRCLLSTPNLNFAVGCLDDAEFRDSVLQSDLSVADGWPILAVARLLGLPLPERVAGSGLFERLCASAERPAVSVFLFGGPDGAAQTACQRLNASAQGVVCAGFDAPGFGSIDAMSTPEILARINACDADFVVVALGAKKGQAWILRNRNQLKAPLISHLGAVVNFAAGSVLRAPRWVQAVGLEWLWRIKEEPALWRRYARDGLSLLQLLAGCVIPHAIDTRLKRPSPAALAQARLSLVPGSNATLLRLEGPWVMKNLRPLRDMLQRLVSHGRPVVLDIGAVTHLDSAAVALLALLYGWHRQSGLAWSVAAASPRARKLLRWMSAGYLLQSNQPRTSREHLS